MKHRIPSHLPSVLSLGVIGQIGQIVFLREFLMIFHGNELSLGIILAAWMVWVGIGSRLGAAVVERHGDPMRLLLFDATAVALLLPATILVIRVLRGFFEVPAGAYLSVVDMTISCLGVMAPVTLLLGAQFVLLARVWRGADGLNDTSGAGKTYVAEAIGNVIGGLLFTFVLVRTMNALQAALLAVTVMLVSVLHLSRSRAWFTPIVVSILVFWPLEQIDRWSSKVQWSRLAPEYDLIETRQSKYGAISVLRRDDQYSFFQSGHLVFSTAGSTAAEVGLEEQEGVVFAHLAMAQHPDPERVLLIGGGLRGTLREITRYPVKHIEYVELDEVLIATARPYLAPGTVEALADPRVRLIHTDGRLFVKTSDATYDMIIVDVPDPTTAVLNRYYTEQFFREAKARLEMDGVLVTGAISTADLRGSAVANRNATIYHTLRRVFPEVLPVGERFLYYFAAQEPGRLSADPATLARRFIDRHVQTAGFSPGHFQVLLQEIPLRRINWILRHHGRRAGAHLEAPEGGPLLPGSILELQQLEKELPPVQERFFINSDFRPVGYYHSLMFWNVLTRGNHAAAFGWIAWVAPWWIAVPVVTVLATAMLLILGARRRPSAVPARFAILCAVFTTGLSTMALQIALLFAFQSVYGFVYEMMGLILAVFMAGLALGAGITRRVVPYISDIRVLTAVQAAIALFSLLIAVVLPWSASLSSAGIVFLLFSLITFCVGMLNGADFPLATACYAALDRRPERSTGVVYGLELFGACFGAAVSSAVVAPVLGIVACCILAAIANATAFVVLVICGGSFGRAYA